MKISIHTLLLFSVFALIALAFDGPFSGTQPAAAQSFGRGRDSGGGGGEDRRESFRRRFGGGDRGGESGAGNGNSGGGSRDWRNRGDRGSGGGGDGERRGDGRSNGSGSSGSGSSSSSSGSSDSKSSTTSSTSMSNEKYAKDIVEKYDKNGDKMLQKDEQAELNSTNRAADLDKDGVITIDELVAHHSAAASTTPSTSSSSSSSDKNSNGNGDSGHRDGDHRKGDSDGARRVYTGSAGGPNGKEGDKRRTYRFSTMADRLPKNLPSYFSRDTNGDGQVSMSEYSRTWSKSTVAEFRKYDVNDDGMITAKEATHSSGAGG